MSDIAKLHAEMLNYVLRRDRCALVAGTRCLADVIVQCDFVRSPN